MSMKFHLGYSTYFIIWPWRIAESQVCRQPDDALWVMIDCGGMDLKVIISSFGSIFEDHVLHFKLTAKASRKTTSPASKELTNHRSIELFGECWRAVREKSYCHHITIECVLGFVISKASLFSFPKELGFDLLANRLTWWELSVLWSTKVLARTYCPRGISTHHHWP
jgi:hypothetical protein